ARSPPASALSLHDALPISAILTLIDDDGSAHQVVVSGLASDQARITLSDSVHDVPIASISRLWYGDYLVLWRPQIPAPRALYAGDRKSTRLNSSHVKISYA